MLTAHAEAAGVGLFVARGAVLDLVWLRGIDQAGLDWVQASWSALAAAFGRAPEIQRVIDQYLETTPVEEVQRRQLEGLLNRHEWKLSQVARVLGVSRLTVYKRMRRLGIERLRVLRAPSAQQAIHEP